MPTHMRLCKLNIKKTPNPAKAETPLLSEQQGDHLRETKRAKAAVPGETGVAGGGC